MYVLPTRALEKVVSVPSYCTSHPLITPSHPVRLVRLSPHGHGYNHTQHNVHLTRRTASQLACTLPWFADPYLDNPFHSLLALLWLSLAE
jgi:hypothetical protein